MFAGRDGHPARRIAIALGFSALEAWSIVSHRRHASAVRLCETRTIRGLQLNTTRKVYLVTLPRGIPAVLPAPEPQLPGRRRSRERRAVRRHSYQSSRWQSRRSLPVRRHPVHVRRARADGSQQAWRVDHGAPVARCGGRSGELSGHCRNDSLVLSLVRQPDGSRRLSPADAHAAAVWHGRRRDSRVFSRPIAARAAASLAGIVAGCRADAVATPLIAGFLQTPHNLELTSASRAAIVCVFAIRRSAIPVDHYRSGGASCWLLWRTRPTFLPSLVDPYSVRGLGQLLDVCAGTGVVSSRSRSRRRVFARRARSHFRRFRAQRFDADDSSGNRRRGPVSELHLREARCACKCRFDRPGVFASLTRIRYQSSFPLIHLIANTRSAIISIPEAPRHCTARQLSIFRRSSRREPGKSGAAATITTPQQQWASFGRLADRGPASGASRASVRVRATVTVTLAVLGRRLTRTTTCVRDQPP